MSDGEKDRYGDKLRDAEKGREDKFFADRDAALVQKLKAKAGAEQEDHIRELARKRCPKCGERLTLRPHLGIEIDECPAGHGRWLADGDFEKLIERETSGWLSRFLGRSS